MNKRVSITLGTRAVHWKLYGGIHFGPYPSNVNLDLHEALIEIDQISQKKDDRRTKIGNMTKYRSKKLL